jgi:hypothetical protein
LRSVALLLALAGCGADAPTLSDLVAGRVAAGSSVTISGTVAYTSYATQIGNSGQILLPDRFVHLALPPGGSFTGPQRAWGVAIVLPGAALRDRSLALPQAGDVLEVTGRVATTERNGVVRPTIELGNFRVTHPAGAALADLGGACAADLDCADDLFCGRDGQCARADPTIDWSSVARNLYGSCQSDADCPAGEHCDPGYAIPATGMYAPHYFNRRDAGLHMCQLQTAAPTSPLCRRKASIMDYMGGRFAQGKEICVTGVVLEPIVNPDDGDTHIQLAIAQPSILPESSPPLDTFGAVSENSPPYKDPSNPAGAIQDPRSGASVVFVGTVRWDDGHGWFEVHPVKAIVPQPSAQAAAEELRLAPEQRARLLAQGRDRLLDAFEVGAEGEHADAQEDAAVEQRARQEHPAARVDALEQRALRRLVRPAQPKPDHR